MLTLLGYLAILAIWLLWKLTTLEIWPLWRFDYLGNLATEQVGNLPARQPCWTVSFITLFGTRGDAGAPPDTDVLDFLGGSA